MSGQSVPAGKPSSWILRLPIYVLCVLMGAYLVAAQWSPADSTSVASGSSLVLIILGISMGLLATVVTLQERSPPVVDRFLLLATFMFVVWQGVATISAKDHTNFRVSLLGYWQTLALVGVLQSLCVLFRWQRLQNKLLHWSFALAGGTSFYAMYQYSVSLPQTRQRFSMFKQEMLQEVGIAVGTPEAMQFENRLFSTEPLGPFALTNSLAGILAPIFVVVGVVLMAQLWNSRQLRTEQVGSEALEGSQKKSLLNNALCRQLGAGVGMLVLTGMVLLLTKSRTAWVATASGLLVGILILVQCSTRLRGRLIAAGVGMVFSVSALVIGLVAWLDPAILSEAGKSFLYRLEYWQGAWQLALRSPWFGYGPLAFQSEYTTVKSMTASENPADPHNMWMEILVCGGFPLWMIGLAIAFWIAKQQLVVLFHSKSHTETVPQFAHADVTFHPADTEEREDCDTIISMACDAGATIVLGLIFFFGLIVYSVNPKSDLIFHSVAFCLGALICYWLVRSWRFSRQELWIVSLLLSWTVSIHLLFSGGWMQPGAMSPLLVGLAGLYLVVRPPSSCSETLMNSHGSKCTKRQGETRASAFVSFAFWIIAALLFGVFTIQPEMRRGPVERMFLENRLSDLSVEDFSTILDGNGWDPDPASWLMRGAFQRLTEKNLGQASRLKWLELYQRARSIWIANDTRNWLVYSQVAIMDAAVLEGFRSIGLDTTGILGTADMIEAMGQSCRLNPSSVQNHLQQAVLSYWTRDLEAARISLARAAEIDQITPHADRKIAVSSIWVPNDLLAEARDSLQAASISSSPGFFKGEPVFSWLRKVTP